MLETAPQACYRLHNEIPIQELSEIIPKSYALHMVTGIQKNLTLLDNFDWDILQSGLLLILEDKDKLQLLDANDGLLASCYLHGESRFWWQLPVGDLADKIEELSPIRAFVSKYSCQLKTDHFNILNLDEKIVVRMELSTVIGSDDQKSYFLKLFPLRGYQKNYAQISKCFAAIYSEELPDMSLLNLLLQSGLGVNFPERKPIFKLAATEPVEAAISRMAVKLIQLAQGQEQGIIDDVDTEFVHQYRVNIRKTRSLISLFKKSFSSEHYQLFKTELKTIGSQSNDLRDLDVFLMDQDYYRSMLPENLWPGLDQIFRRIKRRRVVALKKVVNFLTGAAYQEQISHLLLTLQQPPEFVTKQSGLEIRQLAAKKILAQYQQIHADGVAIDATTPDQAIHDLRIECKKLRYLLELFAELFLVAEVKQLVKLLKVLQDNLGHFNDFSVQREFLVHFGQGKNLSADQLASINGLAAVLFNKQVNERNHVAENIALFVDKSIRNHFNHLFKTNPKKGLDI
ncbi:MAG: CHAD domain-containing protein [Thermodesulfobacteriota bacterium]|nr:CHAD domain-containing protein [Thermodesulfobacteriota bacterium]